jgi:hypothetical protein
MVEVTAGKQRPIEQMLLILASALDSPQCHLFRSLLTTVDTAVGRSGIADWGSFE